MTATRTPAQAPSDAGLQSRNIGRLALQGGSVLPDVEIAYLSMGRLRVGENNVVLVTHGLTSGPQMLLASDSVTGEGTWSNLVGPGCAIDTDRYFVVCPNMLGSSYGSTGPTSIDPTTGKPYGPAFPAITVGDIVRSQRRLLQELGIDRVHAVVGPSYGGIQALQWAIDFPALVDAIAVVVSGPRFPASLTVDAVRDVLRRDPNWNDGHYAEHGGIDGTMKRLRLDTLHNYGLLEVLADQGLDAAQCARTIDRLAEEWAAEFDANSLLALVQAGEQFDACAALPELAARLLWVTSITDKVFPPSDEVRSLLLRSKAPVAPVYSELDSRYGHVASGTDYRRWEGQLRDLLA